MYRPNNAQLLMADLASDACDAKESPDELLECIEAAEAIVRDSLRGAVQTPGVAMVIYETVASRIRETRSRSRRDALGMRQ